MRGNFGVKPVIFLIPRFLALISNNSYLVDAMKDVHAIKEKRYGQHIKNTLKPGKQVKKAGLISKAQKKIHLIRMPFADEKQKEDEVKQEEGELLMEVN
jgi:hypothetical protein